MHYWLLLLFIFFISPAFANQLIIEPEDGRQPIVNAINDAKQSIDLVMYGFTDDTLLQALLRQHQMGKQVKVILEESPYKADDENKKTIAAFNTAHIDWHGHIPPYRLIHQKTLLIDHQKAMVMTFNFTHSTFKNERNFAVIIDQPPQVKVIADLFAIDWQPNNRPLASLVTRAQQQGIVISPETSRDSLSALLNEAHHSLNVYAQNVNDYKLVGLFAKAARRGIQVRILTSATMRQKQADYLAKAGVTVRYSKQLYIHAKVMLVDDTKALVGSINLTRASIEDNRELALLTQDAVIVKQLGSVFEKDWQNANAITKTPYQNARHDNQYLTKMTLRLLHQALNELHHERRPTHHHRHRVS